MLGLAPDEVVGFRYINNAWQQIPVQIDERRLMDMTIPYSGIPMFGTCLFKSEENVVWDILFYTDPNTFTGADTTDLNFDADDELAFMAKDVGGIAPASSCPGGVYANSKCQVQVQDPLNGGSTLGYIYLFEQDGSLSPDAGVDYVDYDYEDFGGNYKGTYLVCVFNGSNANPEDSRVTTDRYSMHFSQRWVNDELQVSAGNASNIDILDRHQFFTDVNSCARNEVTFSDGKGPIIAYKEGPIRGIRSVMGANSGTFTQLDVIFTECRTESRMFYRMHPGPGFYDVMDYNADVLGMTYYNNQIPNGVPVDGIGDQMSEEVPFEWELIVGAPGAIATTYTYDTDMSLGTKQQYEDGLVEGYVRAFHNDAAGGLNRRCTGDGKFYGASGFVLRSRECTDDRYSFQTAPSCMPGEVRYFEHTRYQYYLAPQTTTSEAANYATFAKNPLLATSTALDCTTNAPTCTDGLQNGNETGVDCGGDCPTCPSNCPDETISTLPPSPGMYDYINTNSITSTATVEANTAVLFQAATTIQLLPGFHAKANSTFTAQISPCAVLQRVEQRSQDNLQIEIAPNPVRGQQLNLRLYLPRYSDVQMRLYDINGRRVGNTQWQQDVEPGNHTFRYDLHGIRAGLYLIEVKGAKERIVKRVLVLD
jgi:hypothetical protein